MTNIYVGNLSYNATEDEVRNAFEQFGAVANVQIIKDRETGRSRGFAFVEMMPRSGLLSGEEVESDEETIQLDVLLETINSEVARVRGKDYQITEIE